MLYAAIQRLWFWESGDGPSRRHLTPSNAAARAPAGVAPTAPFRMATIHSAGARKTASQNRGSWVGGQPVHRPFIFVDMGWLNWRVTAVRRYVSWHPANRYVARGKRKEVFANILPNCTRCQRALPPLTLDSKVPRLPCYYVRARLATYRALGCSPVASTRGRLVMA